MNTFFSPFDCKALCDDQGTLECILWQIEESTVVRVQATLCAASVHRSSTTEHDVLSHSAQMILPARRSMVLEVLHHIDFIDVTRSDRRHRWREWHSIPSVLDSLGQLPERFDSFTALPSAVSFHVAVFPTAAAVLLNFTHPSPALFPSEPLPISFLCLPPLFALLAVCAIALCRANSHPSVQLRSSSCDRPQPLVPPGT